MKYFTGRIGDLENNVKRGGDFHTSFQPMAPWVNAIPKKQPDQNGIIFKEFSPSDASKTPTQRPI
ncbi:hypothetical protein FACS1894109_00290 [Spirochaetia bacterium]|nr:hypothetical protein FACS1894109_00290 [Spirochaetia bacterium]